MHHSSIGVSDEETGADGDGRKFVEKVVEEDFFKRVACQFRQGVYLGHEVLIFELISCEPLHSIVESFGDRENVNEFHKSCEGFLEISYNRGPPDFGRIIEGDLVDERHVRVNRTLMRNHSRQSQHQQCT